MLACPQLMDDDFGVSDGGAGPSGEAGAGTAQAGAPPMGLAGSGGAGAGGAGAGGAGAAGAGGQGTGGPGPTPPGGAGAGSDCGAGELGPPTLVSELDLPGELWGPALSNDGRTLYFALESAADAGDLYRATRVDADAPFAAAAPIAELNTESAEGTPYASADGTLYFSSEREGQPDIWRAVPKPDGSFMAPELVPIVNSASPDFLPCLSSDGLRLLFGSNRDGAAGQSDLWMATRATAQGGFSAAFPVSELNTGARDEGANLTADDLRVYFTSDREGSAGLDIWYSTRYNIWSGFSPPINLATVNAPGDDADVHISRDGRELFFSSARSGTRRIWRSERCP